MLSSSNVERLIAEKRREIEREKTVLGLWPAEHDLQRNVKEDAVSTVNGKKQVNFKEDKVLPHSHDSSKDEEESVLSETTHEELDDCDSIPPALERYIRRYVGLPVMLKAGEYSPNNPLVRGERAAGDALLGLGEYERRRNTLRKIRQQQYREYLDQQAKKKQEAKEQAERERREREQKEREREERERELLQERERYSAERRRSVQCIPDSTVYNNNNNKVDMGVQVDGFTCPLSVAVQTDDNEMFRLPGSGKSQLTEAERELSPRTAGPHTGWIHERRRSYGDYDERTSSLVKQCTRDKLQSEPRYSRSIFDADVIQLRNMQAEKEAAERRQFYQQELKNQILEQQRIREERKTREKMLEQAEMRRLEEQLRMLRVAQDRELNKQHDITATMKENATEYHNKRTELQKEIDIEQRNLRVAQPRNTQQRNTPTTDTSPSKLPFYYPRVQERTNEICDKKPYSMNIPDTSIFSANYDVDSYLRKNLNFNNKYDEISEKHDHNKLIEKALVHHPEERDRPEVTPSFNSIENIDSLPIPVLRHSPKIPESVDGTSKMSEAMKKVDDKWKVPAVQKNILKALPNEEGKSVNILTQLGSIRRQLQLEQLKLDKMITNDDV